VLVFAITQVTGFISADPTWTRLVEGLAILAALWSSSGCAPRGARSTIAAFVQAA